MFNFSDTKHGAAVILQNSNSHNISIQPKTDTKHTNTQLYCIYVLSLISSTTHILEHFTEKALWMITDKANLNKICYILNDRILIKTISRIKTHYIYWCVQRDIMLALVKKKQLGQQNATFRACACTVSAARGEQSALSNRWTLARRG